MIRYTIEEFKNRRVGLLTMKRKPVNPDLCHELLMGSQWATTQCTRKPGHGLGGLFCKQHAKRYPASTNQQDNEKGEL